MTRAGVEVAAVGAVALVAYLGIIGPMDYAEEISREADAKLARVERAARAHAPAEVDFESLDPSVLVAARRCARSGLYWQAQRADGSGWTVICTDSRGREQRPLSFSDRRS